MLGIHLNFSWENDGLSEEAHSRTGVAGISRSGPSDAMAGGRHRD